MCPERATRALSNSESRRLKKQAFLHAIRVYMQRHGKTRRGFNQFAQNAQQKMRDYEVTDDLECYKAILSLFPTDRMRVTSFLQAEWGHFPRQQNNVIGLLQQMTSNHVIPDDEVGQMIIDIFGWRSHAMQHYRHLMYWIPKLAHANPWPVQPRILDDLDEDPLRLTRLIAERICPDPNTELHLVRLPKSEKPSTNQPSTMLSAQSPEQRALLQYAIQTKSNQCQDGAQPVVYLDGPHYVWYQRLQAAYYTLWTELDAERAQREIKRAEIRERRAETTDLTNLPQFGHLSAGHLDTQLDFIHSDPKPATTRTPATTTPDTAYKMNKALLKRPTGQPGRQESEYDSRWLTLRQSYTPVCLPNELTKHEQAEGVVLAIGVVTPIPDALVHQKKLFERLISDQTGTPQSDASKLPHVPCPASTALIRAWLSELQEKNPILSNATTVLRTSLTESAVRMEDIPPSSESGDEPGQKPQRENEEEPIANQSATSS